MNTNDKPDWELAKSLYLQKLPHAEISQRCNVTLSALRKRALRQGWKPLRQNTAAIVQEVEEKGIEANSESVRAILSEETLRQAQVLQQSPPASVAELGNSKDGEGRSSIAKRIADTAALVHGWSEASKTACIIQVGLLRRFDDVPNVTEVESEAKPVAP